MKTSLLDLSFDEVKEIVEKEGQQSFRAKQIFEFAFSGVSIDEMSSLPKSFRSSLSKNYVANPVSIYKKLVSQDKTAKYIYKLQDGNIIEGVLMRYKYGNTICVSTQVGCRMGCKFCASGLNGLVRNLNASEILGQVLAVNRELGGTRENRKITNIVLMGSGEPLDNYDQVTKFLKLVNAPYSLNISQRNISLSTCGLANKIKQLANDGFSITLTISLHSPTDEKRKTIMPIANAYSLKEVAEAAKYYFDKTGRRVVFEYALIDGVNDSFEDAQELRNLLKGFPTHINLIPLNPVAERGLNGTPKHQVYAFQKKLEELGMSATVRRTMGEDIEGACGQLRNKILNQENRT